MIFCLSSRKINPIVDIRKDDKNIRIVSVTKKQVENAQEMFNSRFHGSRNGYNWNAHNSHKYGSFCLLGTSQAYLSRTSFACGAQRLRDLQFNAVAR